MDRRSPASEPVMHKSLQAGARLRRQDRGVAAGSARDSRALMADRPNAARWLMISTFVRAACMPPGYNGIGVVVRVLPAEGRGHGEDVYGSRSNGWPRSIRNLSRSLTAPAARPASAPTPPPSASCRKRRRRAGGGLTCVEGHARRDRRRSRAITDEGGRAPHRGAARRSGEWRRGALCSRPRGATITWPIWSGGIKRIFRPILK